MKNADVRNDVIREIDETLEGLAEAEKYGLFVQREMVCIKAISEAIRLLKAMREVLTDE